jgi:hypothetical protein
MLQNTDGAKRKEQSRETRNIGYTGQINVGEYRRGNKKNYPEKLTTQDIQDTGQNS